MILHEIFASERPKVRTLCERLPKSIIHTLAQPNADPKAYMSIDTQLIHFFQKIGALLQSDHYYPLNHILWKPLYTNYKLLRVLDLGVDVKDTTIHGDVSSLANLRYFRLFLFSPYIPNRVFDLWNLQMLFIKANQSLNFPLGSL